MNILRKTLWLCVLCVLACFPLCAQKVAVKTNLLYDATTTPNLGLETSLGRKSTAQLFYGLNPWKFSDTKQMRHWLLMPEYRWWTCQKFNGHFFGVHAMGGQFNMAGIKMPLGMFSWLENHRYEGWFVGGGLTYGYQFILSRHFNFEASMGIGYDYIKYKKFECGTCGPQSEDVHRHYFGPTKAVLSLVYVF